MTKYPLQYYPGYSISMDGKVYNSKGKRLPEYENNSGYLYVILYRGKKSKFEFVHRLVAYTFLKKVHSGRWQVNHINGNKHCNKTSNLEWCTPRYNLLHARRTGLIPKSIKEPHYASSSPFKPHRIKRWLGIS